MIPVPKIDAVAMRLGNIDHLPAYKTLPAEFQKFWNNPSPYFKLIERWFYDGLERTAVDALRPKEGVDKNDALKVIGACMRSFEPKHEHKICGAAYLLSQWFDIEGNYHV